MTAPVIDYAQSVLGYRAYQQWAFQPVAFGTVTHWTCSALPAEMEFNPYSGKVSGFVKTAGVYSFVLTAFNNNLPSPAVRFVFGIDGSADPSGIAQSLLIDVVSKQVGLERVVSSGAVTLFKPAVATPPVPLLELKHCDDVAWSVKLVKFADTTAAFMRYNLATFKFALKSIDEELVVLSVDEFNLEVVAEQNCYQLGFRLSSPELDALMAENEMIDLAAEFQWEMINPLQTGPQLLRQSSETFLVRLRNDIIA